MGKALFTLLAVFASLLGEGAGELSFTGRGGPFFLVKASAQGSLCVGRAFGPPHRPHVLEGRRIFFTCFLVFRGFGAVSEGHFTRYFT